VRAKRIKKSVFYWIIVIAAVLGLLAAFPICRSSKVSAVKRIQEVMTAGGIQAGWTAFGEMRSDSTVSFDENDFVLLGRRLLVSGRVRESIAILTMATQVFPGSWQAWEDLGEAHSAFGVTFRNAVGCYTRSLALQPNPDTDTHALKRLKGLKDAFHLETCETPRYKPGQNTGLSGPYLGQPLPGDTPVVFAPGIVSIRRRFELSLTFSGDGRELYFSTEKGIWRCRRNEAGWTAPQLLFLKGTIGPAFEPHLMLNGRTLLVTDKTGIRAADRDGGEWGRFRFIGPGMYATTTTSGAMVVTDISDSTDAGKIVRREWKEHSFEEPEILQGGLNTPFKKGHPCIAPDERFVIFDSSRPGGEGWSDFYVCFKEESGRWGQAIRLSAISTSGNDLAATLSPDGRYLFFTIHNDIHWVRADFIDRLRPEKPKAKP
jgi:hypothetical protein